MHWFPQLNPLELLDHSERNETDLNTKGWFALSLGGEGLVEKREIRDFQKTELDLNLV